MGSKQSLKKRLLLPFFFIAPAVFCLSFYYFYIRKPFTQNKVPVFKNLPFWGKINPEFGAQDSFSSIQFPKLKINGDEVKNEVYSGIIVLQFVGDINVHDQAMVCANLFRIQKRVNHVKGLKFLSLMDASIPNANYQSLENSRKVHASELWKFCLVEKENYLNLKNQIISSIPSLTEDSLKTTIFLLDPNKKIRGYYLGNSVTSVNRMMSEIVVLNGEIKFNKKKKKNGNKS